MRRHGVVIGVSVTLNLVLIGVLYVHSCYDNSKGNKSFQKTAESRASDHYLRNIKGVDINRIIKTQLDYNYGDEDSDDNSNDNVNDIPQNSNKNDFDSLGTAKQHQSQHSTGKDLTFASKQHRDSLQDLKNIDSRQDNISTLNTRPNRKFTTTHVYTWDKKWRETHICNTQQTCDTFNHTTLRTRSGGTPIYVYDEKSDKYVSASLIRYGYWEHEIAYALVDIFRRNRESTFIDIGANIGTFALEIAKLGQPVIAIEPLNSNVKRLCCSTEKGNFNNSFTLIFNAISDKNEIVELGKDKNNVGGTFVNKDNDIKIKGITVGGVYTKTVHTILLDDLLRMPITLPKSVIMKIDVEGYEVHVLQGAYNFFEQINVKAVVMEWTYSKNPKVVKDIVEFMKKHKMSPYSLFLDTDYSKVPYEKWPVNIVWLKKSWS